MKIVKVIEDTVVIQIDREKETFISVENGIIDSSEDSRCLTDEERNEILELVWKSSHLVY